jgi:hypothetical protein
VVCCSIVIANRDPDADRTALTTLREAREARGLISIAEESWPLTEGSRTLRSVVSIEADNPTSIRWYAERVLGLGRGHPAWVDMERQLHGAPPEARPPG